MLRWHLNNNHLVLYFIRTQSVCVCVCAQAALSLFLSADSISMFIEMWWCMAWTTTTTTSTSTTTAALSCWLLNKQFGMLSTPMVFDTLSLNCTSQSQSHRNSYFFSFHDEHLRRTVHVYVVRSNSGNFTSPLRSFPLLPIHFCHCRKLSNGFRSIPRLISRMHEGNGGAGGIA